MIQSKKQSNHFFTIRDEVPNEEPHVNRIFQFQSRDGLSLYHPYRSFCVPNLVTFRIYQGHVEVLLIMMILHYTLRVGVCAASFCDHDQMRLKEDTERIHVVLASHPF